MMTPVLTLFFVVAALLLVVGIYCLVVTRNLIRVILGIEVLTKAATLLMIGAGYANGQMATAQDYVVTIIVIEVMLLVIAVGILFGIYRKTGSINVDTISNLKG